MKKLYFLAGASNTGKSSVINSIKELCLDKTNAYFQTSITRDYYKSVGIENEIALKDLNEEERKKFQIDLFNYYLKHTKEKLDNHVSDLAVIDRSPIDHLAFILLSSPKLTSLEYSELIVNIYEFFNHLKSNYKTTICEFEFPCPWLSSNNLSSDGFRDDPFGKNLVISYLITSEINKLFKENDFRDSDGRITLSYFKCKSVGFDDIGLKVLTPLERAKGILGYD
jgi:hypothetical protein